MVDPGVICDNVFYGVQLFAVPPAVGITDQPDRLSTHAGGFSGVGCGRSGGVVCGVHDVIVPDRSLPSGQRQANGQTSKQAYQCLSINKQTHRKGAKNAKCLIVFVKEFLCVPGVFAVKSVFMCG
jgi:hypothetical protein